MGEFFSQLFSVDGFMRRWDCGDWTSFHGWLYIASDIGVWSAYTAIPAVLIFFVLRKSTIPFRGVFVLFGAFILLCGLTHLLDAIMFWWPGYRLLGLVELLTAAVSWATVVALIPIVPRALSMRTPEDLEREIDARRNTEAELHHLNQDLERRIQLRTEELVQANGLLQQEREQLREADQKKDEFLAVLAHELRNPLAPMRNALHFLGLKVSSDPEIQEAREMMERQIAHMVRLVDDLLDVSRISTGKVVLHPERHNVDQVIKMALETSKPLIDAARHELTVEIPQAPLTILGDLTRMAQILSNLLNNSAKYTPEGGHIWLTVERSGPQVVIHVRDNGLGIPSEMIPQIFDMFTQVDRSVSRSHGGLGIGLTLVRRLAEMHGGSVEARSAGLDQGSEFIVRLPLTADESTGQIAAARAPTGQLLGERSVCRVLVVDDNLDSAKSLAMLLRIKGHETRMAYDGPTAIEMAREFRPHFVLLDIGLPGMDGYEVAMALRKMPETKDAVLIAQTGWGQEEDRQRSKSAGFDHHLVKPIEPAVLESLIGKSQPAQ